MDMSMMSMEELNEAAMRIQLELLEVKNQLTDAKRKAAAFGDFSDVDWLRRAEYAAKIKGAHHQMLLQEIGRRNKEQRRRNQELNESTFIAVARRELDPGTFQRIWDAFRAAPPARGEQS